MSNPPDGPRPVSSSDGDGPSWYYEIGPVDEVVEAEDDDDDDLDFHDALDGADEDEDEDEDDDENEEDDEDEDEEDEDGNGLSFELVIGGDDDDDNDNTEAELAQHGAMLRLLRTARAGRWSQRQLMALLRDSENFDVILRRMEDDVEGDSPWQRFQRRRRETKDPDRFPKVPQEEGLKLQATGVFGANEVVSDRRRKKNLARRMLDRELGLGAYDERRRNNALIDQSLIPSTRTEHIIHYDDPIYSGQFSDDGNFFYSCCQDFKVRMYDTSNPYNWKHYKTVTYPWGQWTLTDASLSRDNKWLAYTSISTFVSIAPTDPLDTGDPYTLDLDVNENGRTGHGFSSIWSVRFSGDGRELVAGTNRDSIIVYDIESRRTLHCIEGHDNDVNAVCFADKLSPHIIYSGSDDATIKVWDRRSMGDQREAGAFVGHTEGLTYIDSKGDGRYILSNGKDQSMKLWDIRMAMTTARYQETNPTQYTRFSDFDYRSGHFDESEWDPHPLDNSVVTFRGHKVLNTLIRCHFSPPNSTNSRYVYSGSKDGKVHIWNMDASKAGEIDVKKATAGSRSMESRVRWYRFEDRGQWSTCVRDASWHPTAPMIVASAWNGHNLSHGTCTMHSFNTVEDDEGDPPMSRSVDEKLRPRPNLYDVHEAWQ